MVGGVVVVAALATALVLRQSGGKGSAPDFVATAGDDTGSETSAPPPAGSGGSGWTPGSGGGSPAAEEFAEVDRAIARFVEANVAFNVPDEVNIDSLTTIQFLLGVDIPQSALADRIEAPGTVETAAVKASYLMEARLTGDAFLILPVTQTAQAVSPTEPTEWLWSVRPVRTGPQRLHLSLTAHFTVGDAGADRTVRTFDRDINVTVTTGQRLAKFLAGNWQWCWAALLVPAAGWLWKRRRDGPRQA